MPILFGEAKKILSQYAGRGGKCADADGVNLFVRQVLEYMLYSGEYGNLRKFTFNALKGCFTAPYELEAPIKVKIDGVIGTAWDKWFEYHPGRYMDSGCVPAGEALFEEPDYYPTVYDVPSCGAKIGVVGLQTESSDANLIVKGFDPTGREIFTTHKGEKVSGEYLTIKKGEMRLTQTLFAKITGIVKTITNGHVPLYWVTPDQSLKGFLSDYSPNEEVPSYRRFRLTSRTCGNCVKVTVLGRIRLKAFYADSDIIPFDNLYALQLAGQACNKNYNDDAQGAQAKDATLQEIIARENEHKRVQNGQPIEVFTPTSAGAIQNIIGNFGYGVWPGRGRGIN